MDDVTQALMGLLAAVLTALGGVAVQAVREYARNLIQTRLGAGAARIAGEIIAEVAARPNIQAATLTMIDAAEAKMRDRFPDTTRALSGSVLRGMVVGELGKLGQAVAR